MSDFGGHRAKKGGFKQQNKSHKQGKHRSKSAVLEINRGRVGENIKSSSKKRGPMSKAARLQQMRNSRQAKREATMQAKRGLGVDRAPPVTVTVLDLCSDSGALALQTAAELAAASAPGGDAEAMADLRSKAEARFSSSLPFSVQVSQKQATRFTLSAAPKCIVSTLELAKVANILLLVLDASSTMDGYGTAVISAICAQGVPAIALAVVGLDKVAPKHRNDAKKKAIKVVTDSIADIKVLNLEKASDFPQALWQLSNLKTKPVHFRDNRPSILPEIISFAADPATAAQETPSGTLAISGYVRHQDLDVNGLVYLPGHGAAQILRIDAPEDPLSPGRKEQGKGDADMTLSEPTVLAAPDPALQQSLQSEVPIDPMAGEQTWPTEEELAAAEKAKSMAIDDGSTSQAAGKTVRVPKGTSGYQASWVVDEDSDDDEGDMDEGDMEKDDEMMDVESDDDMWEGVRKVRFSTDTRPYLTPHEDEEGEEYEEVAVGDKGVEQAANYDDLHAEEDQEEALRKLKEAQEDATFPDEVDTPLHRPARERFEKYRGLQSFKTSAWDPKEDLPLNYSRIFQFERFSQTRRRVLNRTAESTHPASVGRYVTVYIANVPAAWVAARDGRVPLVVTQLLEHENKMTVVHFKVKMVSSYQEPIKSKEELVFLSGIRQFKARPLFSQFTNGSKHKFERFFQPGAIAVASMFAPVTYNPAPLLLFKPQPDGSLVLVATGSMLSCDPDRMLIKRIRLSGYPYSINKHSAVIRFMFYRPDDINWFKPVELQTKYGRRGHIKESLGTHGHMKCIFDGPLKQQDTVMMNLYKRVYPKWTYEEFSPRFKSVALPAVNGSTAKLDAIMEED